MDVRIAFARAAEPDGLERIEAETRRVEQMLACQNEAWRDPESGKSESHGRELDRFGTRADDQRNIGAAQVSP